MGLNDLTIGASHICKQTSLPCGMGQKVKEFQRKMFNMISKSFRILLHNGNKGTQDIRGILICLGLLPLEYPIERKDEDDLGHEDVKNVKTN